MDIPKRIIPLLMLIICASMSSLQAQGTNNSASNQSPNIIFILTDDQRFDALGYAGNSLIHTPEMDKLASSGTYFKNATVSTPICAASRASILSGLYERTHRFNFQTGNVRQIYMDMAYPKLLKDAGYYIGFYGKYGIRYNGEDQLFDEYETYDRNNAFKDQRGYYYKTLNEDTVHLTRYTGQKAIDFIDSADPNKPFCLSLSFSAPHAHDPAEDQYFWQTTTDGLLQDTTMPGPELGEDKYFDAQPEFVRAGFNRLRWTWRYDTPEKYQHSVKGYYRMIAGVDLEIGKIREKLKEKGLDKNTVIILMGDNGYFLGERQLAGKWLLYDNSIRVPLIVFDPRVEKQQDSEELAQNVDVPATIVDLAGLEQPESWQGKSLLPVVYQENTSLGRDTVLVEHIWEFENIPPSEGVRTKGWKYFRYVNDQSVEELYDLEKDPKEINNLAKSPEHQETLRDFRRKCDELIAKNSDHFSSPPTHLSIEFIRKPEAVLIKDPLPEFNWMVPKGSIFQSAYQLLVSSSQENIDNNIGDIWDSEQVRESNSSGIEYAGNSLKQGTKYYWKVRIWDEINRLSSYSQSQAFQLGEPGSSPITDNIFQINHIKPVSFQQRTKKSYFIDFGKDAFATMAFEYEAKRAHTVTIRIGEKLDGDQIDRNPGGTIRYQEIQVPVTKGKKKYELSIQPDERNTKPIAVSLPDSFPVLMPFRYAEIEGVQGKLSAEDFTQITYHGYWEEDQSSFNSSNDILNQVWDLCKYSIKATNFTGYYVDGDRERIPYEADAYLNQLSHYCLDKEYAVGRKTIEYFFDSKPTWPTEWQLHVAMMMYQDYMYTGDTEMIEKYYERLKIKTLMALEVEDGFISIQSPKHNGDFLLRLGFPDSSKKLRDIVDWPPESNNFGGIKKYQKGERDGYVFTRINTVVNGFYYHNMKIMAEFAAVLNKPGEALDFEFRAAQVKKSINEQLFNEEKGYYVDGVGTDHGSLHANMILLAFDIVPDSRKSTVTEHVKSRGMACSVYGAQYLLEALYKGGEADYALELMSATHDRSWYNMIKIGSTMTLEAWDMKYKVNGDYNHAWGAVPANIIPRYLWGIQPQAPGYGIARIKPQMGTLKNSSIEVPTMKGNIKGEYKYVTRRLQTYTLEIPPNMVAEFEIEASADKSIRLNGEKVSLAFGSIRLMPGTHQIDLVINSF